jgi:hypothetical protein
MKVTSAAATLSMLVLAANTSSATERDRGDEPLDFVGGGEPETKKVAAIELTPLGLLVGHYGASIEIVPLAHHGLVLSGYYAYHQNVDPQFVEPLVQVPPPTNTFSGVGGELGYRYYFGRLGPHGLYLGPSFLLGAYHGDIAGTTASTTGVDFHDFGGAFDIGYQAIIGSLLIGLGAGVQYVYVDHALPDQNDFFNVEARAGVSPRAALTLGYGF